MLISNWCHKIQKGLGFRAATVWANKFCFLEALLIVWCQANNDLHRDPCKGREADSQSLTCWFNKEFLAHMRGVHASQEVGYWGAVQSWCEQAPWGGQCCKAPWEMFSMGFFTPIAWAQCCHPACKCAPLYPQCPGEGEQQRLNLQDEECALPLALY